MERRPTILLADDHRPILDRAASILRSSYDIVGMVGDGERLVKEALRLNPDVLVVDITMPILSGLEAAHELSKAGFRARIVFLTVHEEREFVQQCFAEGGLGYVIKSRLTTDLVEAVKAALLNRCYVSPSPSLEHGPSDKSEPKI